VALVAERWYVALSWELQDGISCGFFKRPKLFFSRTNSTCNCLCISISVLPLSNFKSNYHNPQRIPRLSLSLNFASCTRYFFVLYYAFVPVTLVHSIHTRRIPPFLTPRRMYGNLNPSYGYAYSCLITYNTYIPVLLLKMYSANWTACISATYSRQGSCEGSFYSSHILATPNLNSGLTDNAITPILSLKIKNYRFFT
jgi:hypothetical protein